MQHVADNPNHSFNYKKVEILDTAETDMKLRIKELLHILGRRPELNKQLGSQSSFDIKTLIIQEHPQLRPETKWGGTGYKDMYPTTAA